MTNFIPPIIGTLNTLSGNTGNSIRDVWNEQNKRPTYVFPADLGNASSNYPMMIISIIDFPVNSAKLLKDLEGQSSTVEPNPVYGPTINNQTNTNSLLVPKDGITPGDKGDPRATIALPITNNITNALQIDWQMEEFAGGEAFLKGADALQGNIREVMNGGGSLFDAVKAGVSSQGATAKGLGAAVLSATLQKTLNVIANPKKQAFFYGVQPRHFQFDWAFTPQTLDEAETIIKIIETITKYSLPQTANFGEGKSGADLLFNFPSEFWISFNGVKGFPKLDPMVCVGITTNYTPNTLQLLNSGHPVQILFSMALLETTIRTQQRPGI